MQAIYESRDRLDRWLRRYTLVVLIACLLLRLALPAQELLLKTALLVTGCILACAVCSYWLHPRSVANRCAFALSLAGVHALALALSAELDPMDMRWRLAEAAALAVLGGVATLCLCLPAMLLSDLHWRNRRRFVTAGHCRTCGYDLTGAPSSRCPECGCATKSLGKEDCEVDP